MTYLLGSTFFISFCKYVKWESGKKWMSLTTCQGKVREYSGDFDSHIWYEPCRLFYDENNKQSAIFCTENYSISGWVHTAPLTNLSVFVDICQPFTRLRFCTKIQATISYLCVHIAHSNGGKNTRFCGFNLFAMLWSRQISVFVCTHYPLHSREPQFM